MRTAKKRGTSDTVKTRQNYYPPSKVRKYSAPIPDTPASLYGAYVGGQWLPARFESYCTRCHSPIGRGQWIWWVPRITPRLCACHTCGTQIARAISASIPEDVGVQVVRDRPRPTLPPYVRSGQAEQAVNMIQHRIANMR